MGTLGGGVSVETELACSSAILQLAWFFVSSMQGTLVIAHIAPMNNWFGSILPPVSIDSAIWPVTVPDETRRSNR